MPVVAVINRNGESGKSTVATQIAAQEVVHTSTTTLDRLAVEDVDAHRALLAVDLAVRRAMFVLDQLDPAAHVQRRVDQLGASASL